MQFDTYSREHPQFYGGTAVVPVLRNALARKGGTFVDLGCGNGARLDALVGQGLLSSFQRTIGIDLSPTRIERLQARLPDVTCIVGDACAIPLPDASVDLLYSDQVIEHVPSDHAMAVEIARVLKPSGCAVVGSVLRRPGAWYIYKVDGQRRLDPTHLREYGSADLYASVFRSAGLRVTDVHSIPLTYPLSDLAMRLMIRLKMLRVDGAPNPYSDRIMKAIRSVHVPIPRYATIYAVAEKA